MSDLNSSLVLHLKLGGLKNKKTTDASASRLAGTVSGAPSITADEDFGNALTLDGASDFLSVADHAALQITAYTVAIWIKPEGVPNEMWKGIAGKPGRNYNIWLHSSGFIHHRFHTSASTNSGAPETPVGSIKWNQWNHVVITNDGATAKTYVNGIEAASGDTGGQLIADNTPLYAGRNLDGTNGHYFKGEVSNLRIYNRALTAAEIGEVLTDDLTGLVLYMKLDEIVSGNTVVDSMELNAAGVLKGNTRLTSDDKVGACLSFDGTNGYVQIPNSDQFNFKKDEDFAVAFWIRPEDPQADVNAGDNDVVEKWAGAQGYPFVIRYNNANGKIHASRWDGAAGPTVASKTKVNDGVFHHIAFVKRGPVLVLFIDGQEDARVTDTTTKATHSTSGLFLGCRGGFRNYFKGKVAHLRIYARPLDEAKLLKAMREDQTSFSAFNRSHPIDFRLSDEDHQNVLYVVDDDKDNKVALEINNTSDENIDFQLNGNTNATADSFHLELRFRPGTLTAASLNSFKRDDGEWSIAAQRNANGTDSVFMLRKSALSLRPDKPVKLLFEDVGADGLGGARGTRVELRYQSLKYPQDQTPLSGFRERHVGIINHKGKKNIPLHVGLVGSNTILNDGGSDSKLILRITNLLKTAIPLSTSKDAPSKLIINFEVEPNSTAPWQKEWALGKTGEVDQIVMTNVVKWKKVAPAKVSENPEWIYTNQSQPQLPAGGSIDINISKIKSSLPSGHAKMYVSYENIPGYWDGRFVCTIEKQPLLFRGTNVGIGIAKPNQTLIVGGTHNSGKQAGSGLSYGGNFAIQSNAPQLDFIDTDHKDWAIHVNSNKMYFVRQPWNYKDLVLDGKGNIGIGTDTPAEKLEVNGNIKLSDWGKGIQFIGGAGTAGGHVPRGTVEALSYTDMRIGFPGPVFGGRLTFGSWSTKGALRYKELMRVQSDGKVGIGLNNPQATLAVNGGVHVGGNSDPGNDNLAVDGKIGVGGSVAKNYLQQGFNFNVPKGTTFKTHNSGTFWWTSNNWQGLKIVSDRAGILATKTREILQWTDFNGIGEVLIKGKLWAQEKFFRIAHPSKPDYDLVHACLEGPESAVYYRGSAKLQNGEATIKLPDYFEALTHKAGRTVILTAKGKRPFLLSYKNVEDGSFHVYGTVSEGEFSWEVKAVRSDVSAVEVEVRTNAGRMTTRSEKEERVVDSSPSSTKEAVLVCTEN